MTKDELLKLVTVLQAELEATNRQVEILSDALAESRREVAALKINAALDKKAENARELGLDYESVPGNFIDALRFDVAMRDALTPPAQPAPVQEPVCDKDPQGCWSVRCQLGNKCKNTTPPAAPVLEGRDWSLLEATQESLREHMAEIKRLKEAQPAVPDAMTSADIQEHIEYVAGWNDCRQAMMEMMK
jgi:hypothetical protein